MNKRLTLLTGILMAFLSGCAHERVPYDYSEVESLKGNLIVYRVPTHIGNDEIYNVFVNRKSICSLQNGSYFVTTIKPKSTIIVSWQTTSNTIAVNEGYIRVQPITEYYPYTILMEKVDAEKAKKEINRFKLRHVCN